MFATDANVAVAVAVDVDVAVVVVVAVGQPTCRYFGLPRIVSCLCVACCVVMCNIDVLGCWLGCLLDWLRFLH